MYKIVCLLVVLAMLGGGIAGCASVATEAPAEPEVRVLYLQGHTRHTEGEEALLLEVAAAFEKEYNCKVEARFAGEWSETPQILKTAQLAGEPIDITWGDASLISGSLAPAGMLMDMTELVKPFQDRWVDGAFEPFTLGGRVYGMPWGGMITSAIYYNASLFKELGLEEPTTYADLVHVAEVIRQEKDIFPMVHQGKLGFMWPMWYFETYAQASGNKSVSNVKDFLAGNRSFNGPEEEEAFEAIAKFYTDGILTQESLDLDMDGMRSAFAQQKAAMYFGGTWELAPLRSMVTDFEVGIMEWPLFTDIPGVISQQGGGPDTAFMIPSFSSPENLDLAVQFLEFLSRKEWATLVFASHKTPMPTIKSVVPFDDPLASELTTVFVPHTVSMLDWIWPAEVNDAFIQAIPAVLVGVMTSEEAAQSVQDAYDTLVVEKGYRFDWWSTWTADEWAKVTPREIPTIDVKE